MNTLIAYLLIASLGSVLFVGLDLVLLQPFASHGQRRHILLFAVVGISLLPLLGFALPLKLPEVRLVYQEPAKTEIEVVQDKETTNWLPSIVVGVRQANEKVWHLPKHRGLELTLLSLWLIACLFYFLRFLRRFRTLKVLERKSPQVGLYKGNSIRLVAQKQKNAFSFLQTIFLSRDVWDSEQKEHILRHESAHIKLKHSYDMILSELMLIPQCFNPFASYLKQALKEVHEYQADKLVLSDKTVGRKAYQYNLLCFAMQGDYNPICQFFRIPYLYNNQLKKRIIMMNKERKATSKWSYLMALPIAGLMLWGGNSCAKEQSTKEEKFSTEQVASKLNEAKPTLNTKVQKAELSEQDKSAKVPGIVEVEGAKLCTVISTNSNPTKEQIKKTLGATKNGEPIFKIVSQPTSYKGGTKALMRFITKHIRYPKEAIDKGIQGHVVVKFVVEKDGSISNAKVVRSVDPLLDKEALRVVADLMPKWNPAKHKGKLVRQEFALPVIFKLLDSSSPLWLNNTNQNSHKPTQ